VTVKELIQKLKQMPQNAEVVKVHAQHVDSKTGFHGNWEVHPVKWVTDDTLTGKVELGGN
jgi:hypothetical protein